MSVSVGVLAHSDFGAERPAELGRYLRRFAETVEAHGLDAIYLPSEIGWHRFDPLTTLGALAAWTERVQLGTCVLLAPLYSPLQVAEAAVTAQIVSGGRVVLGVGMGWRPAEFHAAGIDVASRLARMADHLAVLPALLAGEEVNHQGRCHRFDGVRVALAEATTPVPLWLGAHGAPGIARAARHTDGWIAGPFTSSGTLAKQVTLYRSALAESGRTGTRLPLMRECYVAETREAAFREAEPMRTKYQEYVARVGPMPFDAEAPLEQLAEDRFVIGDPEACADELARYVELTGATDLILRTQFRGMDPEGALRTVALIGDEVAPRLRKRCVAPTGAVGSQ